MKFDVDIEILACLFSSNGTEVCPRCMFFSVTVWLAPILFNDIISRVKYGSTVSNFMKLYRIDCYPCLNVHVVSRLG